MARPPITAKSDRLFRKQIDAALDYVEANASGGGGGGPAAWADITGRPSTFPPATHSHAIADVTGLQTALDGKQATLTSGTNIRTVNGASLLGSGDVVVSGSVPDVLELGTQSTTPSPVAGHLKVFAAARATRAVLRQVGPAGVDVSLQPALFGNTVRMWHPSAGTTIGVMGQGTLTAINAGTGAAVATPTPGSGSDIAAMTRFQLGTGTTATGSSGVRDPVAYYLRGNASGRGGFFYFARFAVETFSADLQIQLGFAALNTALAGEPSAFVNCAMIGKDTADANWFFMHNDASGAATRVPTGAAVTAGQLLDFFMFAPPFGSDVNFELRTPAGTLLASHTATTDLPVNSTMMFNRASIRAPTGTTARQLAVNKIYTETDI